MSRFLYVLAGLGLCFADNRLQAQSLPQEQATAVAANRVTNSSSASSRSQSSSTNPSGVDAWAKAEVLPNVQGWVPPAVTANVAATVTSNVAATVTSPEAERGLVESSWQAAQTTVELQWGIASMKLPTYLRHEGLGLAPSQGLLVTSVNPGGPAQFAGLQVGDLLVELDGEPIDACQGLPALDGNCKTLLVMGTSGLRRLEIAQPEGHAIDLMSISPASAMWDTIHGWAGGAQQAEVPAWATQAQSPVRSFAVSEASGLMSISAIVACRDGERRIDLQGTKGQIAAQLQRLAPELQQAIVGQLGWGVAANPSE